MSEEDAISVLQQAEPYAKFITGIGLDSAEEGNPAQKFKNAYKIAAEKGFCGENCWKVAHAGEESDPTSVIGALYYLGVNRIDHGVRSLVSPALCKFLKESQIPLTVCPLSNDKLQVNSRFFAGRKTVRELYKQDILITINSDDPAFFGGYINENYYRALSEFEEEE